MLINKYMCQKCGLRSCILETAKETPGACPYLIVVPEWKFIGTKQVR